MRVRFDCDVAHPKKGGQRRKEEFSGELLSKEGDKFALVCEYLVSKDSISVGTLSDGSRVVAKTGDHIRDLPSAPKDAARCLRVGFMRAGVAAALYPIATSTAGEDAFHVSDFKLEDDPQGECVLSYNLKIAGRQGKPGEPGGDGGGGQGGTGGKGGAGGRGGASGMEKTFQVKLYYDQKTFKLSKRTLSSNGMEITELYTEFVLDEEIPDEKFTLPQGIK
ncbi:MAG: hypothetical protein HYY16_18520 [Planctomycetes bacterium]|nr:hypothetical protein [Planctomycetota bacterium]